LDQHFLLSDSAYPLPPFIVRSKERPAHWGSIMRKEAREVAAEDGGWGSSETLKNSSQ
jgi:hypothetical protein